MTLTVEKLPTGCTAEFFSDISELTCSCKRVPFTSLENLSTVLLFYIGRQTPLWIKLNISLIALCIHLMCQGKNTSPCCSWRANRLCKAEQLQVFFFGWSYIKHMSQGGLKKSDKPCGVGHSSSLKLGPLCTTPICSPSAGEKSSSWGCWTPAWATCPAWELSSGHAGGPQAPPACTPWILHPSGKVWIFTLSSQYSLCSQVWEMLPEDLFSTAQRALLSTVPGYEWRALYLLSSNETQNKYSKLFLQN